MALILRQLASVAPLAPGGRTGLVHMSTTCFAAPYTILPGFQQLIKKVIAKTASWYRSAYPLDHSGPEHNRKSQSLKSSLGTETNTKSVVNKVSAVHICKFKSPAMVQNQEAKDIGALRPAFLRFMNTCSKNESDKNSSGCGKKKGVFDGCSWDNEPCAKKRACVKREKSVCIPFCNPKKKLGAKKKKKKKKEKAEEE